MTGHTDTFIDRIMWAGIDKCGPKSRIPLSRGHEGIRPKCQGGGLDLGVGVCHNGRGYIPPQGICPDTKLIDTSPYRINDSTMHTCRPVGCTMITRAVLITAVSRSVEHGYRAIKLCTRVVFFTCQCMLQPCTRKQAETREISQNLLQSKARNLFGWSTTGCHRLPTPKQPVG